MIRFLVDEDMPRSTPKALRKAGFECLDVRDIGLRGAEDDVIYRRAQVEDLVLITDRQAQRNYYCKISKRNADL
jgi:predicted nuclease of predicted toxin-antitoxin system